MSYYTVYYDTNGNITGTHKYEEMPDTLASNQLLITEEDCNNLRTYGVDYYQVINGTLTPSLTGVKNYQLKLIVEAYISANEAPIAYMNTTFQADSNSQSLLQGAIIAFTNAGATPAGFYWLDANNNQVAMTLAQLQGLGQAIANRTNTNFQKYQSLKTAIKNATTVAEVQAINWS